MFNNTIDSDLIRGHIDTIILKALYEGDRYGFDIIKEIEQKSGGQYVLKQPTLYSCLKRLEVQGFIKSYWGTKSIGGRRKYFTLTDMGRELFTENLANWKYSRSVIDKLISDGEGFDAPLQDLNAADDEQTYAEENAQDSSVLFVDEFKDDENNDEQQSGFAAEQTEEQIEEEPVLDENNITEENNVDESLNVNEGYNDNNIYNDNINDTAEQQTAEQQSDGYYQQFEEDKDSDNYFAYNDFEQSEQNAEDNQAADIDTDSIMDRLFEQNSEQPSYIENIASEEYTPKKIPAIDSDNYFFNLNYYDDEKNSEEDSYEDNNNEGNNYEASYDDDSAEIASSSNGVLQSDDEQESPAYNDNFVSYDSPAESLNFDEDNTDYIIERDYRKALDRLIEENTIKTPDFSQVPQDSVTAAKQREIADERVKTHADSELLGDNYIVERIVKKDFDKLVSNSRDMGEDISVRTHNSSEMRQYSENNYYYSNQLRLYHFGIIFVLMLIETAASFLIIELGIKSSMPIMRADKILYLAAVLFEVLLPIGAIIVAYSDFYKRKRYNFSLKTAVIFRTIVAIQLIVIVYALNVYRGIITGNIYDYLSSLIMPSVLALNLIFSPFIFNALYKSKKFAVK